MAAAPAMQPSIALTGAAAVVDGAATCLLPSLDSIQVDDANGIVQRSSTAASTDAAIGLLLRCMSSR